MNNVAKDILTICLLIYIAVLSSCTGNKSGEKVYAPQSFDELQGHTVCLMSGSIQQDYAVAHPELKDVKYVYFASPADCMLALIEGKADVFFGADIYAYNESFHRQHLKISHVTKDCGGPAAYGVKKGNMALANDMDAFIDSLTQLGILKEIEGRWFNYNNTDFHNCVKITPTTGKPHTTNSGQAGGKGRVLRVGTSGVKPPAEVLIDNKWTGCEIEVLQMYAQSRGLQLQLDAYDFDQLIPALEANKIDVAAATLAINAEREKKITFIHPFVYVYACFIIPDPDYQNNSGSVQEMWKDIKERAYYSLIAEERWQLLIQGFWMTIRIALCALFLGMVLGGAICWLRMNRRKSLRAIAAFYINIMRNIPMLVFLMLMFYVFLADTGLSTEIVAIIAFGMNSSAYICEIYRTGIDGVDKGQTEAGYALGFSPVQTFCYIVAPQAARLSLPVFKNEVVTLLKGTSIVGYISIIDLTKASDLIRGASFEAFFPLLIVTVVYFILAWLFTTIADVLIKRI